MYKYMHIYVYIQTSYIIYTNQDLTTNHANIGQHLRFVNYVHLPTFIVKSPFFWWLDSFLYILTPVQIFVGYIFPVCFEFRNNNSGLYSANTKFSPPLAINDGRGESAFSWMIFPASHA